MNNIQVKLNKNKRNKPTGKYELYFHYNPALVEAVKALPSKERKYVPDARYWVVSVEGLDTLANQDAFKGTDCVQLDEEAFLAYKGWVDRKAEISRSNASILKKIMQNLDLETPLPSGRGLLPHQKEDVLWALESLKDDSLDGLILALDMGLGKTFISLFLARLFNQVSGCDIIVISPASLLQNWRNESVIAGVDTNVFSWGSIPKTWGRPFILIADEAHFAQSGDKSQRGEALMKLASDPNRMKSFLLSGTPMKNGKPRELYPLLHIANHPVTFDKSHYDKYFCGAKLRTIFKRDSTNNVREIRFWDNSGAQNLDALHKEVKNALRYRKKEDCTNLPEKIRMFRAAEVQGKALSLYKEAYRAAGAEYEAKKADFDDSAALTLLMRLRKAGSLAKTESTIDIAQELLAQKRPVVIFTEFLETVELLHNTLGGEVLTGATKIADRQACVDRFQSGKSMVFVGTSKAAGVGLTLPAASDVILCDRPWSPGDAQQAEDRVHRIGQKNTVMSFWIQFGETDEKVDFLLQKKYERISLALEGSRKTMRGIASKGAIAKAVCKAIFDKEEEDFDRLLK